MYGASAAVVLVFAAHAFLAVRAQDLPQCVATCMMSASKAAGCSSPSDWKCMCAASSFRSAADRCFADACTSSDDRDIGENMVNLQCSGQTSTSIRPPFSPPATTSLTVTNSETSPPQQSSGGPPGRPHTSISQAPPTPPPSSPAGPQPAPTVTTPPGATPSATPVPSSGTSAALPSSLPSLTSSAAGAINFTTEAAGNTTGTTGTLPGPFASITTPPDATGTQGGNGATRGRVDVVLGVLLGAVGAWTLL